MDRSCDNCGKAYSADQRNVKRGWGLCCSKSCAASKREKSKSGYDPNTVASNNHIRTNFHKEDSIVFIGGIGFPSEGETDHNW